MKAKERELTKKIVELGQQQNADPDDFLAALCNVAACGVSASKKGNYEHTIRHPDGDLIVRIEVTA